MVTVRCQEYLDFKDVFDTFVIQSVRRKRRDL